MELGEGFRVLGSERFWVVLPLFFVFVCLVFYFVVFATLDGAGSYPQFIAFYSTGDGAVLGIVPRPLAPKLCVPALNIFSGGWSNKSNKTVDKVFVN